MRLLILSQYFWPENFRINDVAAELSSRGHAVTVLTGVPNYHSGRVDPRFRRDPSAFRRMGAVEVVRVPMLTRGRGRFRLALNYLSFAVGAATWGAWRLRGRPFDRILVYQPSPATIGLPAVVLRRLKGIPLAFWVQDLWPDTLQAMGVVTSRTALGLIQCLLRGVYRNSDHIIAQSRAFLPLLGQRTQGVPLSYLPNWSVAPDEGRSPVRYDRRPVFKIYFTGNLGAAQDLPTVVEAISRLAARRDIHWCFVGDGSAVDWLRAAVARAAATDRVHLLGRVPPEELRRVYADADALLVCLKPGPLFGMTVPSKLQSYLASGLPILAMLDGEGARIVAEAGAGLVVPAGDAEALAAAALQLAALSAEQRQAMGEAGRRYGEANFGFLTLMDQLESLLVELGTAGRERHAA